MGSIYRDPETGASIATHSMLKTFRRCPMQTRYKYLLRLKPKITGKPLHRGSWIHKLLEVHYKGGDWEAEHQQLSLKFNEMFDEEKEQYGDLPREIRQLMQSYFWHYQKHDWKILDVEFTLETELPDGTFYRGKIDLLVEDQYGLWIVDHKSHKRLPEFGYRLLDSQSALYIWAALRNHIPVQGHIWNYIRTKSPTVPQLLKTGDRISRRAIDTDYLTYGRALKKYGISITGDYALRLRQLKAQQYQHGEPQLSSFFRRDILEKSNEMVRRVAQEGYHTARRMNDYPWDKEGSIERVPDRSCTFTCDYMDLCTTELFGGDIRPLIRQRYQVIDPMYYYYDEREGHEKGDG